jgi:hypothetical protein
VGKESLRRKKSSWRKKRKAEGKKAQLPKKRTSEGEYDS